MFTPEDRSRIRASLIEKAAADPRITGAAITGSAALGREDAWSDIDLAFGTVDGATLPAVLDDFTAFLYSVHSAVHHLDIAAGPWTYRVFLLPGTLQVDLAFVAQPEFRALAPSFQLVAGVAEPARHLPEPPAGLLIGYGWLYALHARTSIARGSLWQAEYMISGVRDHTLALACLRHGLPTVHGRGFDMLPPGVLLPLADAIVLRLDHAGLSRAFTAARDALLTEIRHADAPLAGRLQQQFEQLL